MSRLKVVLSLAVLFSTAVATSSQAQASPREIPRTISVLGDKHGGEIRFHLTQKQLETIGIPEIGYTQNDKYVADISEVGLIVDRSAGRIEGIIKTALGEMAFRANAERDGITRVEYDLSAGRGTLALTIDRVNLTAKTEAPEDLAFTVVDRFIFRSLAVALEREVGNRTPETDALLRASNLWGGHPISPIRLDLIRPSRERGWTNLCGVTSASLAHDATTHGLLTETLATGPNAYQCRARCGEGCTATWGTSAWTVDCGEHDRCVSQHGDNTGPNCGDEFDSASDDYLFAPNCHLSGW